MGETPVAAPLRRTAVRTACLTTVLLAAQVFALGVCPVVAAEGDALFIGQLVPLEQRLLADAEDGQWDEHSLLSAALIASGVGNSETLEHYRRRVSELAGELRQSGKVRGTTEEKAQAILEFLHRRVLTGGYLLESSDLTLAFEQGQYNCVTATVLFNCLAEQFGLEAGGLEKPGHALSRVKLPGGDLEIETTCSNWFRLRNDPAKRAAHLEKVVAGKAGANDADAPARPVSDVELVATIYYNLGVDALMARRFREALAANAKSLRLDPANSTTRGNLLATLNNWAIDLGERGSHSEAASLLRRGLTLDPKYPPLRNNYRHVHRQWAASLTAAGQYPEAAELLADASKSTDDDAWFRQAQADVYRLWARSRLESGRVEEAFGVFDAGLFALSGLPSLREFEAEEVGRHASRLLDEGRFAAAVELYHRALIRQGEPSHPALLAELRQAYRRWQTSLSDAGRTAETSAVARQAAADPYLSAAANGI